MHAYTQVIALILLTGFASLAQAADPVAQVLLSIGKNQAVSADGQSRALKRQSAVYAGERIETAARGRVQLRFSDGSLLSLKANTQFAIDQYRFDAANPNDGKAVYKLIKGGMRTVTGLIGREEKEDYRLDTPVATIGIRGTHYSLHFCDAGCAARSQQPEGLFGGVIQGGIHVDNGSGRHDINIDDFFYVADTEAEPEALLAPPELLVEEDAPASEGSDDAQDGSADDVQDAGESDDSGDDGSATGEETTQQDSGTDTGTDSTEGETAALTSDSPAGDGSGDGTATTGTTADSGTLGDFGGTPDAPLVTTDPLTDPTTTDTTLAPATDPNTNQTVSAGDNLTTAVAAPNGAAMGVAFVDIDSFEGLRASGHTFYQGGDVSILLDEVAGAGNVPVFISLTDPGSGAPEDPGCNPCTFSSASAALVDIGGLAGADMGINWGRWSVGWTLTENGVNSAHKDNMHFIYSPNRTGDSIVRGISGALAYHLIDGTLPTDEFDNEGGYNAGNEIRIDFTRQMLVGLDLNVFVGGKVINARQLHSLVPFDVILSGESVPLIGFCTGGSCGGSGVGMKGAVSLDFVGPGAERIISAWGLFEDDFSITSDIAVAGTAAFEQNNSIAASTFSFAPPGSALQLAFVESDGPGAHAAELFSINSDVDTAIVVDTVGGAGNVPIYTHFSARDSNGNIDCPSCEISAADATLVNAGGLGGAGLGVNWGRWNGHWAGTSQDPMAIMPFGDLHFIYSPNTTPDTVVRSMTGSFSYNAVMLTTAPPQHAGTLTDEQGNMGTLSGSNRIGIDFNTQTITDVTLTMQVNGRNIGMTELAPMPIDDVLKNLTVELTGSCSGGDCGAGTAMEGGIGIDFVGPAAERLVTSFGANDTAADPSIAVTGTAVFDR